MSPSESTNMAHDGDPARLDGYFASPELSQRADLLRHLTENSTLIPLIRGCEGMGKTTFIQRLLDLAPENWIPVEICADVMLQPDALLADLADLFDQDVKSDRLMDDLIMHFDDLRQDGFLPVIIVDDAHLLPEATIITLLRLHERGHNDTPLAQILLFAEPEIDDLLKTPQLRVMNLQSLQLLDMPEFTLDQTGLFLEHLLSSDEGPAVKPLTQQQIERIHSETGGVPGLIKEQAQGLIDSAKRSESSVNIRDYFSTRSMIGAGVVSVIVMLVLIYQNDINAIFSGDEIPAASTQEESVPSGDSIELPIPNFVVATEPERPIVEKGQGRSLPQGDMEIVEGEKADLGPADQVVEEQAGEVAADSTSVTPDAEKDDAEKTPATPQTQQVRGQAEEEVVPPADEKEPAPAKEAVVTAPVAKESQAKEVKPDQPQPVVQQDKPEKAKGMAQKKADPNKTVPKIEAQTTIEDEKPPELEGKAPIVKRLAKTPAPTGKVTAKPTATGLDTPKQEAIPLPAPVEDRSTALIQETAPTIKATARQPQQIAKKTEVSPQSPVVAKAKKAAGAFLREEWLLKQSPTGYTIQLVGLQDEKGIAEFVQRHGVSGHVAYYRTQLKGKPWFPVLYGAFSTKSRAMAARDKLPESLIKTGVWVRALSSVQNDIRSNK